MLQTLIDLTAMAEALSRSADYRVLQRLVPRAACQPTIGQDCRTGTLDTETTGLDHDKDEIIELGMVKFDYTPDGGSSASETRSPLSTSRVHRFPRK